jgi:hypothetical protein
MPAAEFQPETQIGCSPLKVTAEGVRWRRALEACAGGVRWGCVLDGGQRWRDFTSAGRSLLHGFADGSRPLALLQAGKSKRPCQEGHFQSLRSPADGCIDSDGGESLAIDYAGQNSTLWGLKL